MVYHFYHVYADGDFNDSVNENFYILARSKLLYVLDNVYVGIVGSKQNRDKAKDLIKKYTNFTIINESDEGFEQSTLNPMIKFIREREENVKVLYTHTKGSHSNTEINTMWRRNMNKNLICNWVNCVNKLQEYDAIGCYFLTPGHYYYENNKVKKINLDTNPDSFKIYKTVEQNCNMFAGNFWWSKKSYMDRLPDVSTEHRWCAESWICSAYPYVLNVKPGWPSKQYMEYIPFLDCNGV